MPLSYLSICQYFIIIILLFCLRIYRLLYINRNGVPKVGAVAIMLALVSSMGGFIFGYDTGQISDILVMEDFKLRFATCSDSTDHNTYLSIFNCPCGTCGFVPLSVLF